LPVFAIKFAKQLNKIVLLNKSFTGLAPSIAVKGRQLSNTNEPLQPHWKRDTPRFFFISTTV